MKKILNFLLLFSCLLSTRAVSAVIASKNADSRFTKALTAGYVFKSDCAFKQVYGPGIVNVITGDWCYYPWDMFGIGAKLSYWRAKGETSSLRRDSLIQEVPFTAYLRGRKDVGCNLELYASLGGGGIWIKEKSYLGKAHKTKGIGEAELGLNYSMCGRWNFTSAFRYLFPYQGINGSNKIAVGGYELRGGIGYSF